MATNRNKSPIEQLDELDRKLKQSKMIRQYLDMNENVSYDVQDLKLLPSTYNFHELRQDLKMAEERVDRLRHELKEIQAKGDESFFRKPTTNDIHRRVSSSIDPSILSSQSNRPFIISKTSKDRRQHQFLLTMRHHREQLTLYLNSLKQALKSLDTLVTLEPSRSEVQLTNMKLETINQKSRQLRALKTISSSQQAPFIECRIRQLEHDLIYMLNEHQKDVQGKLELNEQRSLMLLKIMQVTDELTSVDQQIQQLLTPDNRHISFRESPPLTNAYYYH